MSATEDKEKPGWKTTEFWLSLAAAVVGILLTSGAFGGDSPWSQALGVASAALAGMGYTYGRAKTKEAASKERALKAGPRRDP